MTTSGILGGNTTSARLTSDGAGTVVYTHGCGFLCVDTNFSVPGLQLSIDDSSPFPHPATATTTAVPEPSTWAMLATGFAGLGFVGMRRGLKVHAA